MLFLTLSPSRSSQSICNYVALMKPLLNIRKTRSWEEVDYLTKTKWIRIQFFSENIFHIKSFIGSRLAPVCSSCLWLTLADFWVALAGSGWFWVALSGSGVINRLVTPTCFYKNKLFLKKVIVSIMMITNFCFDICVKLTLSTTI